MKISSTNEFKRGWSVLLASFLGIGVSLVSVMYYSAGIWIKPWQDAFGWTRAEIGFGQTLMTLMIVLTAPFAGQLIDKYGLRKISSLSLLLYGIGLYAISQMNGNLWAYYFLMIITTIVGVAATPLGFTRAVNAWFDKNRGLALGLSLTSTGVAAFFMPKYLIPYVAEHGWRAGYFILFVIVLIVLPIVWWLIKDHPPDAEIETETKEKISSGLTFKEASATRAFWTIALVFFLISIAIVGLILNFIPLLQDAGFNPEKAGNYAAILGASVIIGRLLTGFLIDRLFAPYVTAAIYAMVAGGFLALGLGGITYALVAAIAFGFAIGAEIDLIGYFTARYFGLKNYGTIYGFQYSVFSLGAGISPVLAGYIWDSSGNYDLALIGGAILLIIAVIIALTLPRFSKI